MAIHLGSKIPIKISLAGNNGVGKTSLVSQYVLYEFKETYQCTIGAVYNDVEYPFADGCAHVQIWDTAGQERYKSLVPMYFRDSDIVFLLFDVSERKTFDDLSEWLEIIEKNTEDSNLDVIIVGNKCDLGVKRAVETEEAEQFCKSRELKYFETSAKTRSGVDKCFNDVITAAYERLKTKEQQEDERYPIDGEDEGTKKKKCCQK